MISDSSDTARPVKLFINLTPLVPLSFKGELKRGEASLPLGEGNNITTLRKHPDFDSGVPVVES